MAKKKSPPAEPDSPEVAAADLGSNSFHMIVARPQPQGLVITDRIRESVRLAAGLDSKNHLDGDARRRALECLARFGQRLQGLPLHAVRAVGTNTLRQLRHRRGFLADAESALGYPIEIVSGYEEARLIYLGVAHSIADDDRQRLVVDIGGGSTELIIGKAFAAREMESLHMGCVSTTARHFADGAITEKRMARAELHARRELEPIVQRYRRIGWDRVIGASGTIRAVERCLRVNGWSGSGIDSVGLARLRNALLEAGHVHRLSLNGVGRSRAEVIAGGVAVLSGIFQALKLEHMEASDGALREGLLFDLLGRIRHEDVREATVTALATRYHVDDEQARRVAATVEALHTQAPVAEPSSTRGFKDMLIWAARLHEVGLDISHSQYHKHGAYILHHSDLAGFSREEQSLLATLVRVHRRKLPVWAFEELPADWQAPALRLAVLLRLSVVLNRARNPEIVVPRRVTADGTTITLKFGKEWLSQRPLIAADLEEEADYLARAGVSLRIE